MFIIKKNNNSLNQFCFYYTNVLFITSFLVSAADIPYFNHSFSRFSITAFKWMDSPAFVVAMIFQEWRYWLAIVPFVFFAAIFFITTKWIWKNICLSDNYRQSVFIRYMVSVLFLFLILIAMRGRIDEKSPIRVGTAYFSNNAFLNQLGLNPNFTLMRSFLDQLKEENQPVTFMDNEDAIKIVQRNLKIVNPDVVFPVNRTIYGDSLLSKKNYNVVIIIMESMSAHKMRRHGNTKNLTPFLDSISERGIYFDNIYSGGIHTFNGIFSTLFSFPTIFRQHPMKESSMLKYNGISNTLRRIGYSTIYFTTHDGQFDNVEGFLLHNDFETIISKDDYPSEKVATTLGVPDDFMFEYSIPVLNGLWNRKKPFLAVFMTASDHGPYYVPDYFKPTKMEVKDQIVEYADWSLRKFIELSSNQNWFDSTVFVFVADHGASLDGTYEIPLSYTHIPLLFYNPKIFPVGKLYSNIGGQIDVYPTIMGILNHSYSNNTLGIDLTKETRPFIFFNADDKYGVINDEWYLIVRKDNSYLLHKYRQKETKDYSSEYPELVLEMKTYAEANMQVYQYLLNLQKQFLIPKKDCFVAPSGYTKEKWFE